MSDPAKIDRMTEAAYERAIDALEKIPRRIDPISGQRLSYVQIGEAVEAVRALVAPDQVPARDALAAAKEVQP